MKNYLFFTLCFVVFACSPEKTEDTVQHKDTLAEIIEPKDSATVEEYQIRTGPDSLRIAKLKFYAATWDASYFPLPSESSLTYSDTNPLYTYLIANFDTLSTRAITEHYEGSATHEPCAWKQTFKSNITYSLSSCTESGESITIETQCPDKKVMVRLVDILFHSNENQWNADSTEYRPIEEEAGCYYSIKKNSEGNYTIEYYCGC